MNQLHLDPLHVDLLILAGVGVVSWVLFVKAPAILNREPKPPPPPEPPPVLPYDDDGETP